MSGDEKRIIGVHLFGARKRLSGASRPREHCPGKAKERPGGAFHRAGLY